MINHRFLASVILRCSFLLYSWMSPEVLRGDLPKISEKSDVWSFGVIVYEIVTRSKPWKDLSPHQIMYKMTMQGHRLVMPEGVQPEILALVNDCWNEEPSLRPSFATIINLLLQLSVITPPGYSGLTEGKASGQDGSNKDTSRSSRHDSSSQSDAIMLNTALSSKGATSSKDPSSQPASSGRPSQPVTQAFTPFAIPATAEGEAARQNLSSAVPTSTQMQPTYNPFLQPVIVVGQPADTIPFDLVKPPLDPPSSSATFNQPPQVERSSPFLLQAEASSKLPSTSRAPSSQLNKVQHPPLQAQPSSKLLTVQSSRMSVVDRLLEAEAAAEAHLRRQLADALSDLKTARSHLLAIETIGGGYQVREEALQRVNAAVGAKEAAEGALAAIEEAKNLHKI